MNNTQTTNATEVAMGLIAWRTTRVKNAQNGKFYQVPSIKRSGTTPKQLSAGCETFRGHVNEISSLLGRMLEKTNNKAKRSRKLKVGIDELATQDVQRNDAELMA